LIRGKPASQKVLIGAQYIGLAFVLTLMLAVIGLDVLVHLLQWF